MKEGVFVYWTYISLFPLLASTQSRNAILLFYITLTINIFSFLSRKLFTEYTMDIQ